MLKRVLACFLTAAITASPIYADEKYETERLVQAYTDTLEEGSYYVPVQLWNAYADQESMGNVALKENNNALVKVKDGTAKIDIVTNPVKVMAFYSAMENLRYTDKDGNMVYAEPVQKDVITAYGYENNSAMQFYELEYLRIFEITVPADKNEYTAVEIRTPYTPMQLTGEWTQARLKFDWANAVKTNDTSIIPNPVSPENTTQTTVSTETTTETTTVSTAATTESTTQTITETTTETAANDQTKEYFFGSDKTALKPGTYDLDISMKNAGNLSKDSVAASCIKGGRLIVSDDGTTEIEIDLESVSVGIISDWAEQWKIYKSDLNSETFAAEEVLNSDGKVERIRFPLPDNSYDGVYVNMYVSAMGTAPNAYLLFNYDSIGREKNVETYMGTAHVDQFGEYDVNVTVTVKDGIITDVAIEGVNFAGTHADYNKIKLQNAADGLNGKFNGKSITNAEAINSIDAVSSATVSSSTIKKAVINALSLTIEEENINIPTEKLSQGEYTVDIAYYSDVVKHSLVENEKIKANLKVDENGNITLITDVINGTSKEPLYVLDFNGYYTDNDLTKSLKTDAEVTKGDVNYSDDVFAAGTKAVTKVSFPLEGDYAKIYNTNTKLYVPAMKNLNDTIKGITFVNGVFDADCFVTVYWDSLKKSEETTENVFVYSVPIEMVQAANPSVMSMGNDALDGNAIVTVKDGKAYADINFKAVVKTGLYGHLIKLWSYPAADKMNYDWWDKAEYEIPAEVIATYNDYGMQYPSGDTSLSEFVKTVRIQRDTIKEDHIYIRVQVDAMAGFDQTARINFDWSNAELISGTEEKKYAYGDADGDNIISASDAAFLLQKALISTFEMPVQKKTDNWMIYADADCDNTISASDAAFVLQKALTSTFELPNEKQYKK